MKRNTRRITALALCLAVMLMSICVSAASFGLWRGDASNNGIVNLKTPRSLSEASLKWTADVTDGWRVSSSVIDGDYIYVATDVDFVSEDILLKKISLSDGEIKSTLTLGGGLDYTAHPICVNGVIYVPLSGGAIEAVDASEMTSLWKSDIVSDGGQNISPLCYDNGYIYSGIYSSGEGGAFYCISTDSNAEGHAPVWCFTDSENPNGHYWNGAAVSGDAVIFGSECGNLYSVNKADGTLIDTYTATSAIRSSVMLSYGKAYFTSKDGKLYVVPVNSDGTFGDGTVISLNADASTSTPVMYNGRIYVGASSGTTGSVCVIDAYTYELIYSVPVEAPVQSSPLLSYSYADDTQKVYIYVTYNNTPGGIKVIEDFYGNTEPIIFDLFVPTGDSANYCLDSITADENGNLYYHNDSGNLFAIDVKGFSNAPVSVSVVPANATVEIKDVDENVVSPTSSGNYDLAEGEYTYSAKMSGYDTKSGTFTVTEAQAEAKESITIRISLVRTASGSDNRKKVYFSLIGDTVHGTPDAHSSSVKWIPKTKVYIDEGDTVFTVFDKVLSDKGFSYTEKTYNYISKIKASEKFDSITLGEGDNGTGSGWLYTVNDEYPLHGMREEEISDGDAILVYYTDDYTLEPPSFPYGSSTSTPAGTVVGGGGVSGGMSKNDTAALPDEKIDETDEANKSNITDDVKTDDTANETEAIKFTDVPEGHWASTAVERLAALGVIKGRGDGIFAPDAFVTRSEFAAFLARCGEAEIIGGASDFADVEGDGEFSGYIAWCAVNNLIMGNENGEFMPDENITREDAAVIILRFMNFKNVKIPDGDVSFADQNEISDYAKTAVDNVNKLGIMNGKGNNIFAPKDKITRSEAATVFGRVIDALA